MQRNHGHRKLYLQSAVRDLIAALAQADEYSIYNLTCAAASDRS